MSTVITSLLGLGIFLYGMHLLVVGLNAIASDTTRKILSRSTRSPINSVLTGTGITAILQSSSMVSLIVLAFASSGMIPLFNAVGVILGANLGTTFTGWVVATIGFKMNLEAIALPCFGLSALLFVFSKEGSRRRALLQVFMGFGLLIFGLDQMKNAVADLPSILDAELIKGLNPITFALIGILMTAVIQSSSAMTMIALTSLHSGLIDLYSAAALIIGADLGTTSTTLLGSLKGSSIMKQLALSHCIYNVVVDGFAFLVMLPLLPFALEYLGINDPLYGLVLFHSSFNFVGLLLFLPFLKQYSKWLSGFFLTKASVVTEFIHKTPKTVTPAALNAIDKETKSLIYRCLLLNLRNLKIDPKNAINLDALPESLSQSEAPHRSFEEAYRDVKEIEGEIRHYCSSLAGPDLTPENKQVINALLDSTRDAVYSCKTLKDIRQDLVEFRHPKLGANFDTSQHYQSPITQIYSGLFSLLTQEHRPHYLAKVVSEASQKNEALHQDLHDEIILHMDKLSEALGQDKLSSDERDDAATLLNTNREIWLSNLNIIDSVNTYCKTS